MKKTEDLQTSNKMMLILKHVISKSCLCLLPVTKTAFNDDILKDCRRCIPDSTYLLNVAYFKYCTIPNSSNYDFVIYNTKMTRSNLSAVIG